MKANRSRRTSDPQRTPYSRPIASAIWRRIAASSCSAIRDEVGLTRLAEVVATQWDNA